MLDNVVEQMFCAKSESLGERIARDRDSHSGDDVGTSTKQIMYVY